MPARTAAFRQRLALAPGEKLVGMSWLSKNAAFGASKSTTLAQWAQILRTPGVKIHRPAIWRHRRRKSARLARDLGITLLHIEGLDLKDDLDGVAALTAACDLVITVSNTAAHIAAALGIPTWILIASGIGKFWYWGFDAPTVPWYPTARLVRQQEGESWERPLRVMAKGLQEVLKDGRPPRNYRVKCNVVKMACNRPLHFQPLLEWPSLGFAGPGQGSGVIFGRSRFAGDFDGDRGLTSARRFFRGRGITRHLCSWSMCRPPSRGKCSGG